MTKDQARPEEFRNEKQKEHDHIKGWGIDADPKNEPTYPMRIRGDNEMHGFSWPRPPQQSVEIEVMKSIERQHMTAVVGTSVPPAGLSGMIRRAAYKKSESSYGRWVPLILADRIGIFEGLLDDLRHGIRPNSFAERGWQAEWKYNRKSFLIKSAVSVGVLAGIAASLILLKKRNSPRSYR